MASEEIPWTLKGVSEEIRAAARKAAAETGQTVGEWLSGVIRTAEVEERLAERAGSGTPDTPGPSDDAVADLRSQLAGITRRLDEVETKTDQAFNRIMERLDRLDQCLGDDEPDAP